MARVDVQFASAGGVAVPSADHIRQWAESALDKGGMNGYGLTVRIVDEEEMLALNAAYRNRSKTTNVLSFPMLDDDEDSGPSVMLGDIVISTDTAIREANEKAMDIADYFTILLVHGLVHLLGHDHEQGEDQAREMAQAESELLEKYQNESLKPLTS